jgi:hypothetical protein
MHLYLFEFINVNTHIRVWECMYATNDRNGPVYAGTPYRNLFLYLNFILTLIGIYYISVSQTVVSGCLQAVSENKALKKLYQSLNEWKIPPIHVCAKTAFVNWQSTERRISSVHNFLSFNHYFKKFFKLVSRKECGYGNFNHWHNVSPIHLYALLGVGNFTKVVHVWADRLWSGPRKPKFEKHYTISIYLFLFFFWQYILVSLLIIILALLNFHFQRWM